jgi:hypothetical protein
MTLQAAFNDGTFNYTCAFEGLPGTTLLTLGLKELVNADLTLEAYGVTVLTDYPNALRSRWMPSMSKQAELSSGRTPRSPPTPTANGEVVLSF